MGFHLKINKVMCVLNHLLFILFMQFRLIFSFLYPILFVLLYLFSLTLSFFISFP